MLLKFEKKKKDQDIIIDSITYDIMLTVIILADGGRAEYFGMSDSKWLGINQDLLTRIQDGRATSKSS